jgi:carbon-monoxide dehydrogenase medium subunit
MKPAPFEYFRPHTLDEAVALLGAHDGEARLIAGGQSLVPLMNFRLLRPGALIDINRLTPLEGIADDAGGLRIGALTRHVALETAPLVRARFPVLAEAISHVGHLAVRNRGTIGGSLAYADPAAELPLLAVLLDADIRTRSLSGVGSHAARDFFLGPLTTALGDDEIVTEIVLPALPPGSGSDFAEVSLRGGDFAIVAAAATLTLADGRITQARLAVTGLGEVPLRLTDIEAGVVGHRPTPAVFGAASQAARAAVAPASDLRASAAYRSHLVGVLTERVLSEAGARAR